jgi:hypothetical protein
VPGYRALIAVPIQADDDDNALRIAFAHASSLHHPGTGVIAGHLELLGQVTGSHEMIRVIHEDPEFWEQLPPNRRLGS